MSGVGKSTAALALARRYDLHLYALDSRTYAHAYRMDVPALRMTLDELWVERSSERMSEDFEDEARRRFGLVLEDLAELPDDAPVIAEGPQLLPELVGPPALFVVAHTDLQRRLLATRGSFTESRTRDPERAVANRARRDELLAEHIRRDAGAMGFPVVEVGDVAETRPAVEQAFEPALREWLRQPDRGDVAARRRSENDRRLEQWRLYAEHEPRAAEGRVDLACECDRPACPATVEVGVADAGGRPHERPTPARARLTLAHGPSSVPLP